jgi:hypothetical protein
VLGDVNLRPRNLFLGLKHVPAIRDKGRARWLYEKHPGAAAEPAEVSNVGKVCNKKRISPQSGKGKPEPIDSAPA